MFHNNAHRLSISWARLEPKEGKFDKKEVKHYRQVLEELKRLKMKTMVTLHHFVNPLWFSEKGGWEKKENLKYFERYINFCIDNFGNLIDYWVVFNEPNVYINSSYLQGTWPPQEKSLLKALKVYFNIAAAHRKAYKIISKDIPKPQIGAAIHMVAFKASLPWDRILVAPSRFFSNYSYLALTKRCHDFMGINYYAYHVSKLKDIFFKFAASFESEEAIVEEFTDMGWPIYPQGIYRVVKEAWSKYKLPIFITENGLADSKDKKRAKYIIDHLSWLHRAIEEGVDVRGYFHWTLMDNFEWHVGRKARFGLFETNYKTLERRPRKSAFVYGKIARTNSIPASLLLE